MSFKAILGLYRRNRSAGGQHLACVQAVAIVSACRLNRSSLKAGLQLAGLKLYKDNHGNGRMNVRLVRLSFSNKSFCELRASVFQK